MNFTTHALMKIFIWYFSILVAVEFVKNELELLISKIETPMLEVEF